MFDELSICVSSVCCGVPCEAWLWAALAFLIYEVGG